MIGKLPKYEVSKQSYPDRPGLQLYLRYPSTKPLMEFAVSNSGRSSMLELQGGLPTGREVLRTSPLS
jgi:hypothetical protein